MYSYPVFKTIFGYFISLSIYIDPPDALVRSPVAKARQLLCTRPLVWAYRLLLAGALKANIKIQNYTNLTGSGPQTAPKPRLSNENDQTLPSGPPGAGRPRANLKIVLGAAGITGGRKARPVRVVDALVTELLPNRSEHFADVLLNNV